MDTILYTIDEGKIQYAGITDNKDIDYVKELRDQKQRKAEQLDHAMSKIMNTLSQGAMPIKDVDSVCLAEGISRVTLQRAKRELKNSNIIREWSEGVCDKHIWYMEAVKHSINDTE